MLSTPALHGIFHPGEHPRVARHRCATAPPTHVAGRHGTGLCGRLCRLVCWMVLVALPTGCAPARGWLHNGLKVGPEYNRPAAPVAEQWIDAYDENLRAELPDNPEWWLVFEDPLMTQLINDMHRQNLSLRVAGLRVLESRYQRAIAAGSLFPQQQQMTGSYQRLQRSTQVAFGNFPGVPGAYSQWATGFDMIWELDVWGRFRRSIEAADANLDASVEGYDSILVSLLAETAATYVDVRTLQQRLKYAQSNIEAQEGSLKIAEARFDSGAATELDVTQARTSLQNTRELIPTLTPQLRQTNNRLCVLLGIPPRDMTQELGTGVIPTPPATVAVGMPANLIRRRPDVRQAERQVAAQSALIGVAVADLLPHFSISGNIGHQASDLDELFTQNAFAGSIMPAFNWSILNYGRLLNNIRVQDARFQQLAVTYQQTVLEAAEETENAIINYLQSQQRLLEVEGAVAAAQRSVELAQTQYREGATDFNRVFILQEVLVQQQDRFAVVQGQVARNLIAVYMALGGGWEIRLTGGTPASAVETSPEPEVIPAPPDPAI